MITTGVYSILFYYCCTPNMHCREAHIIFKPGKSHNRYFDSNELLTQVDHVITIFEGRANGLA